MVFRDLSFRVGAGQLLALTGPNGAGKSTLLRVIAGLLAPDLGVLRITGAEEGRSAHYVGHADALKAALTLGETLAFWAALYREGAGKGTGQPFEACADAVGLGHALALPVSVLSAGQRKRAALARLLVAPRPLWLLDEPTTALDRAGMAMLGEVMRAHLGRGGAIVAASHEALPVAPDARLDLPGAG
jgi:heme exporter protein A